MSELISAMNTSLVVDAPKNVQQTEASIVTCSSESDINKATNVLVEDTYRTWQTNEKVGEASIVIQFAQPTVIKAIDIGNAGSAFIEVLVGYSNWEDTEYQLLVPMTSFMTGSESKDNTNRNKTKRFEGNQLASQTSHRKWEKVRVVCKQPFGKDNIGLSFIKFYSPLKKTSTQQIILKTGDGDESMTDLNKTEEDITVPTELINQGTVQLDLNNTSTTSATNQSIAKSQSILSNIIPGKSITIKRESSFSLDPPKDDEEEKKSSGPSSSSILKEPEMEDIKTDSEDDVQTLPKFTPKGQKYQTPFGHLLKGVVIVIGGIVNPQKAMIREKAIEMGAGYKPDWCREATHLITPLIDTPKYKQANKSGGSIVLPEWIEECYKQKDRLPIKSFQVTESVKQKDGDSDDEKNKKKPKTISTTSKKRKGKGRKKKAPSNPLDPSDTEDEEDGPNAYDLNDDFIDTGNVDSSGDDDDDGSSTDDEDGQPKFVAEDTDDMFAEGMEFLKRTYGSSDPLVKDAVRKHSSPRRRPREHKSWDKKQEEKYSTKPKAPPKKQQQQQQDDDQDITPPISPVLRKKSHGMFDDEVLFHDTTQELSALVIKEELTRMISAKQLQPNDNMFGDFTDDSMQDGDDDTDEDNDILPEHFKRNPTAKLGDLSQNKGKEYILDPLPSFFDGIEFYLSFKDETLKSTVTRYIIAYKGIIASIPKTTTRYIVTDRTWEKSFALTQKKNPSIQFVKPSFVIKSHNYSKLVAPLDHLIVQDS
ncbi:BRCT domain-containing protein [Cavenderia fasciculata]|uniref:BRCT domain-containing protein n=1 Tax=Cavenderia fasciculata TaxID=261658 RepID=F4PJN0_CACFS|nr:BRCT domain-containing protein [Cavenderia fasciculata]EGG23804.1 BRCT domain-containing protein [Cavenderia fasciculata]|eukprot:XP_004361655.1 BRCT domain-containing protein [Cavenderia fasciculata]